jgi:molybdopterin-guanine dinucleotide biosynthesis protein A
VAGLEFILPVVLAGGKSRRFGRDKLAEPWPDAASGSVLVDVPIRALREVFGPRVCLVGPCDPSLRTRADGHIDDLFSGAGPLGGIVSALSSAQARGMAAVFVLAGDLPHIGPAVIREVLKAADAAPDAPAVLASSGGLQPCIGLYRAGILENLRAAIRPEQRSASLASMLPGLGVAAREIDASAAANANTPADLGPPRAE